MVNKYLLKKSITIENQETNLSTYADGRKLFYI